MIKFYWNCITGLEFWIIKEPFKETRSKKRRKNTHMYKK